MHSPFTRRTSAFRLWSSAPAAQRFRRPTDVLLLIVSLVVVALLTPFAPGATSVDDALAGLGSTMSTVLGWLWELSYASLAGWTLAVVVITAASRRRQRLLVDYLLAAGLSVGGGFLVYRLVTGSWPSSLSALATADPRPTYTVIFLALSASVLVTASPHLAHPLRLLGRAAMLIGAVAAVGLGIAPGTGAIASLAIGVAAGAAAHLILGTPAGRSTPDQVADALGELGLDVGSVDEARVREPGVSLMLARTTDGRDLSVKVYGRDAWDGQVVGSVWTSLTRKGERPVLLRSRTERVEHEAMITLLAERAGVPVVPVVVAGSVEGGDALLVTGARGPRLDELTAVDDAYLVSAWDTLSRLHALGVAHGNICARTIVMAQADTAALCGFDEAEPASDAPAMAADRACLLVATALAVGPERAVAAAKASLGTDGLVAVLPYLQPSVVGADTGRAVALEEWSLAELRSSAVAATGVDGPPPLAQLRRVTVKSVLIVLLIGVVAYTLIGLLSGVDFASVWAALSTANFAILAGALALSPTVQAAYSVGTLGASPRKLRYVPVLMLQYAIQFIALTLPSTAARIALEVRFFQRFGLPPTTAVSIGVVDSVSGFVVQIVLLLVIGLSSLPGFTSPVLGGASSSTTSSESSSPTVLYLALGLVVLGVVLAFAVPRFRTRIRALVPAIRTQIREQSGNAKSALMVLRRPRKVVMMVLGNLGAQVLQAIILGICLAAFGETAHLSQLILINTAVSLFAGLMPVPGGMGVAEAGYTAGLQAIGIPSAIAMSTAIAFRLVTFYLPPLWGAFAMRWLRRSAYV